MKRILLLQLSLLLLISCNRNSTTENQEDVEVDSTQNTTEIIDESAIEKDSVNAKIVLIEYGMDGLMLPNNYEIFDIELNQIGTKRIDKITALKILRKSANKHPKFEDQDYCDWANYVEIAAQKETLIVFGASVLNISSQSSQKFAGSEIAVIQAENFTTESEDDGGLTGCDDFSYIAIKDNGQYFLVKPAKNTDNEFAVLYHDEGENEEVSDISISADSLILDISYSMQDGMGKYKYKIFKNDSWKYVKTERINDYQGDY